MYNHNFCVRQEWWIREEVFLKRCMKGREFVKNWFAKDGGRHRKLLKCLGVHTFSKMTVEKSVLSASYWGFTVMKFTVDS